MVGEARNGGSLELQTDAFQIEAKLDGFNDEAGRAFNYAQKFFSEHLGILS